MKRLRWATGVGLMLVGSVSAGCGGGDSKADEGDGGGVNHADEGGGGGANHSGGVGGGSGRCQEVAPLVAPRSLGTSVDLFRGIASDDTSGELFISDYSELYRLPAGMSEPARIEDDLIGGGKFWLEPTQVLLPGQFSGFSGDPSVTVLYSLPRAGGTSVPIVTVPKPSSISELREVSSVTVVGDDVYWIQRDATTENPARLPPIWNSTYFVYKTSWTAPSAPLELYRSQRELEDLVIAGKLLFVDQEVGEPNSFDFEQQMLSSLTAGSVPEAALAKFGGQVLMGNDDALLVSRVDVSSVDALGSFRIRPDGTGAEKISSDVFPEFEQRGGTWLIEEYDLDAELLRVFSYDSAGRHDLGCIDHQDTTVHALGLGKDAAFVSILRAERASVLKFPL